MAYSTGNATDQHDLLSKIKNFLDANGFSINKWEAAGTGWRLNVNLGDWYMNFRSAVNENITTFGSGGANTTGIAMAPSTGYDPAGEGASVGIQWRKQPGAPIWNEPVAVGVGNISGAVPQYHFFLNADGFIACIEVATGTWEHLAFGQLTTFGSGGHALDGFFAAGSMSGQSMNQNTGIFGQGTYPKMFAYFNNSDFAQHWFSIYSGLGTAYYHTSARGFPPFPRLITSTSKADMGILHTLLRSTPGHIANLTPLYPSYFSLTWLSDNDFLFGYFDSVRCSIITPFTALEEITIGLNTWKIFPVIDTVDTTRPFAIAVKKEI